MRAKAQCTTTVLTPVVMTNGDSGSFSSDPCVRDAVDNGKGPDGAGAR